MLSERIKKIRDISFDYGETLKYIAAETVSYEPDASKSVFVRHAEAFFSIMDQMSLNYIPGSLIAGNGGDKFVSRPEHLLTHEFDEIEDYPKKNCSDELLHALGEEIFFIWPFSDGHIAPGFDVLVKTGINGLLEKIENRLADNSLNEKQREFLTAMRLEWEAVVRLEKRYEAFFREKAEMAREPAQSKIYQEIADTIGKVPESPAESFREALQSVYFLHMCTQFDDVCNHSFGRFDQYMYPYYRRDIDNGILTEEEAKELFREFWLKFTPGYIKSRKEGTRSEGQGFIKQNIPENGLTWMTLKAINPVKHVDDGQTMDLCGLTREGEDATNAISWLCLECLEAFKTFEPKPVVKYTEKTDKAFMELCFSLLQKGYSHPAISYHSNGAAGMSSYEGYYNEDNLLDYCHIGCVELGIGGKSYTDPMNCFINLPKILLITMHRGFLNGKQIGVKQKAPESKDELIKNYYEQLAYFLDLYVNGTNKANPFYARFFCRPLVSGAIEGCIEKARPVDEGGSIYWSKGINAVGLATTVDSIQAINELVYEHKEYSLEELTGIIDSNYENYEVLRQRIINRIPKYGNNVREVDEIAANLVNEYSRLVRRHKTYLGTPYRPGLYSFYESINRLGRITGATPNGRLDGERFSLNIAPAHGRAKNGVTAALKSVTSFGHSLADNACPVDIQLSTGTPVAAIRSLNEFLSDHGALFLQMTVADRESFAAAEKNPNEYEDLNVRVSGFSAQYISLDADTRHEIMERTGWE